MKSCFDDDFEDSLNGEPLPHMLGHGRSNSSSGSRAALQDGKDARICPVEPKGSLEGRSAGDPEVDGQQQRVQCMFSNPNHRRFSTNSAGSEEPLPVRDSWKATAQRKKKGRALKSSASMINVLSNTIDMEDIQFVKASSNFCIRHMIMHPTSRFRFAWDLVGALFTLYDAVLTPLDVFELPYGAVLNTVNIVTLIYWTLNMISSLFVGYIKDGVTIMDPKDIMIHYVKTWLVIDLITVLPDWLQVLQVEETGDTSSSTRVFRVTRLLRATRLLRLLKLKGVLEFMNDLVVSEATTIIIDIVKMLLLLLGINHYVACIWWLVSSSLSAQLDNTWVKTYHFEDESWIHQYVISYHWSITQMTPATMSVQPQNLSERLFAVGVVIFALVGFSYAVGSITSSLAQLRGMNQTVEKEMWRLRRYLRQNDVPMDLFFRVQRYLQQAIASQQQVVPLQSLKITELLSDQLREELLLMTTIPHLMVHPLFTYINQVGQATMQRLCNAAITKKHYAQRDRIFLPGNAAQNMHVGICGRLIYVRQHHEPTLVRKGQDWICEHALWTSSWVHVGLLVVAADCEVMQINPAAFADAISLNPSFQAQVSSYAAKFMEWLNSSSTSVSDVLNLDTAGTFLQDFVDK